MTAVSLIRFTFPLSERDMEELEKKTAGTWTQLVVLDQLVQEHPMIVEVDREVWHSLDKTSTDAALLIIAISDPIVQDQHLEDLAEVDECVAAAREILRENDDLTVSVQLLY